MRDQQDRLAVHGGEDVLHQLLCGGGPRPVPGEPPARAREAPPGLRGPRRRPVRREQRAHDEGGAGRAVARRRVSASSVVGRDDTLRPEHPDGATDDAGCSGGINSIGLANGATSRRARAARDAALHAGRAGRPGQGGAGEHSALGPRRLGAGAEAPRSGRPARGAGAARDCRSSSRSATGGCSSLRSRSSAALPT